jgi:hypothetical protein
MLSTCPGQVRTSLCAVIADVRSLNFVPDPTVQDTCQEWIFCSSWICVLCGRSVCADCFHEVGIGNIDGVLICGNRREHSVTDFAPMTRLKKSELDQAIREMKQALATSPASETTQATASNGNVASSGIRPSMTSNPHVASSSASHSTSIQPASYPQTAGQATHLLSKSVLPVNWAGGVAILVKDVGKTLRLDWSPHALAETYGSRPCASSYGETSLKTTAKEFLDDFGRYDGREHGKQLEVSEFIQWLN